MDIDTVKQRIIDAAHGIVRQRALVQNLRDDGNEAMLADAKALLREREAIQAEQLVLLESLMAARGKAPE